MWVDFEFKSTNKGGGTTAKTGIAQREGRRIERNDQGIDRGSVLPIDIASPRDKWCNPIVCSDITATQCIALQ